MQLATDHEATVKSRADELAAIAQAKKILEDTAAGAVSQTYSLLQVASSTSSEVVTMVKKLARDHHSSALAQLASKIEAVVRYGGQNSDDVFAKVKSLINELVAKLEKEAAEEATEKAFCDEEMAKTEAKKQPRKLFVTKRWQKR